MKKEFLRRRAGDDGFVPGAAGDLLVEITHAAGGAAKPGKEGEIFLVNLEALRGEAAGPLSWWRDKTHGA